MKRRSFLQTSALGALAMGMPSWTIAKNVSKPLNESTSIPDLKFGIVADVHKDLMPDADARLDVFLEHTDGLDFIIQLGDFCMAVPENKGFMERWNSFDGPAYHVLGNHDMDKNSKAEMLEFWNMPATYYSFIEGGFNFIVLDANFLYQNNEFIDYERANFYVDTQLRTFVHPDQIEWLDDQLSRTDLPTIIFSHQSLWHHHAGVKNRLEIQSILETHSNKILCCMNGHNHLDYLRTINDIHYLDINSMSYQWVSPPYTSTKRFEPQLYNQYPNLPHIAGYTTPLFAIAELWNSGTVRVSGQSGSWMSPSPFDLGMPQQKRSIPLSASISNYDLNKP